ncbi:MAG TPA: Gfo/Idh/MocA family oxidoreductase [Candidatus Babeliales bacterium]|nr:Gfo/Idh/MocA family oxidoreductase [Candidatus Babeliales bacterium]
MRHEFLNEHAQKVKKFAQPLLDDHAILVAIEHIFFASQEQLINLLTLQSSTPTNLPYKIKTVFERSKQTTHEQVTKSLYSFSGHVIASGAKVLTLRAGDAIACIGFDGAVHSDLACISEYDAVLISDLAYSKQASITGFALQAMHAILRANLQIGQIICIMGFGPLGYLIMKLAKLSGTLVIVIDTDAQKISDAHTHGADYCYNSTENGWIEEVLYVTQQHGVDTTFVLCIEENSIHLDTAINLTSAHGRIVLVSSEAIHINHMVLGKKDIDVAVTTLDEVCHHGELYRQHNTTIPLIKWRQRSAMQRIVRLIEQQDLHVDYLIQHQIQSNTITPQILQKHELHRGTLLSFPLVYQLSISEPEKEIQNKNKESCTSSSITRFIPAMRDTICIGIIGADYFVKDTLMPLLSRIHNVTIRAIADVEQTRAEHISHIYGVAKTCSMDNELWQGDTIDVIIVASNNTFRAERVIHALEHYKAVFVKEPIATSFEQLNRLAIILNERAQIPICLDYYRSYAPFIRKIKNTLQKRSTPLMMRYRVNTCTSLRCTQQEDITVGNIIADSCHFLDIFCYLTDAQPLAVSVEAMHTMRDDIFPTDNFTAQISFTDGSVCSLVYTSLGHEHFGGEHLEIFFDSKVIVMQDFLTLHGYGLPSWFDEVLSVPDTGRKHIISSFFSSLRESPDDSFMSHSRIVMVSKLALIIDQLACTGGGTHKYEKEVECSV